MERELAVLMVLGTYIVIPGIVGLAIVGTFRWWRRRASKKAGITELVCTIDADCPPGYVCVGGRCVSTIEAQSA